MASGYSGLTNTVYRGEALATAKERHLVRPNVDTLYSTIFYDLAKTNLEFTVPDITDRYWCFPFYDLYGNNFANISSLEGRKAGKYLLRLVDDNFGIHSENIPDGYLACVDSPTPYGIALIRILVNDYEDDMAQVVEQQKKISLKPTLRAGNTDIPTLDLSIFMRAMKENASQAIAVMNLLATFAPYNKPKVIGDRQWVENMLKWAGIFDGRFEQPAGTDLALAVMDANASAYNIRRLAGMTDHLGNGWTKTADHILGDYGSNYNARHIVSIRGYLALTSDQAFYPVYSGGNPAIPYSLEIRPHEAYLVTFSSRPQLKHTGFWSLTVYDGDGYLIPNELDRYVLGNRSALLSDDGDLLYPCNDLEEDKSFQILLQPADIPPPKRWTPNWIPAPAKGGTLSFSMRFYGAMDSMLNGDWIYPVVKKIDAICA